MNRPIVNANWIYENAGRGMNIGPYTHDARITRNVIADNCANPLGGLNDCSANIIYWGFTKSTDAFNNNTVAFPHFRYNLAGMRLRPGHARLPHMGGVEQPRLAQLLLLPGQRLQRRPAGQRDQPRMGRQVRAGRPFDHHRHRPQFANRTTPVHAWRNYRIPAEQPLRGVPAPGRLAPPGSGAVDETGSSRAASEAA